MTALPPKMTDTAPALPPATRIAYLEEVVIGCWALLTGAGDRDGAARDWIRENVAEEVREITGRRPDLRDMMLQPSAVPIMRTGRSLSLKGGLCTVYRVTGPDWDDHEPIGVLITPELAAAVCAAVNAAAEPLPARGVTVQPVIERAPGEGQ